MTIDPDAFRPLPIVDERTTAARAEAEALLGEANRMHGEAESKAHQLLADAQAEAGRIIDDGRRRSDRTLADADSIREQARAEAARRQKRDDNLDTWAARAIIAGTVGLTASGEYSLARMVGFDKTVAWLLPFVIDVYVIQAFRRHRDIVQAITLTVAANVTYHLADARLFGLTPTAKPTWWLIAMVASVASLILWRVHLMTAPPKAVRERRASRRGERQQTPAEALVSVEIERPSERPQEARKALTVSAGERAQEPATERQDERPSERPAKPVRERRERAQKKPKKSAPTSVTDRRRERVRALYDELGKRPEWTEIRDALVAERLAEKTVSRATCQRVRDAIEKDEPKLAELGSDNVRALPGS